MNLPLADVQVLDELLDDDEYIIAIDVGKGTEDVLVYKRGQSLQNSIQLVLPSMTQLVYQKILAHKGKTLKISGDLMAGEPWHKLVYQWNGTVLMTKNAAMSLKYDLQRVQSHGIRIVPDLENADIVLNDVGWARLKSLLVHCGLSPSNAKFLLLCAQEHGDPPKGENVKDFRMNKIWGDGDTLHSRLLSEERVPTYAPRFVSLVKAARREFPKTKAIHVMDSAAAVLLGAMDPTKDELVVNIGNGHVSAMHHAKERLLYVYEGHTGRFNEKSFLKDLNSIYEGTLTHEDVVAKGGHGLRFFHDLAGLEFGKWDQLIALGPNRHKVNTAKYVHPMGNMMMAGPIGLFRALLLQHGFHEYLNYSK